MSIAYLSRRVRAELAIALVAALPFCAVLGHGFVYDDHWTIEGNPFLAEPLASLVRTMFRGEGGYVGLPDASRPVMVISTWIDRRLFGEWTLPYHLESLILHAFNSVVAARLALVLTRSRTKALVAGAWFAIVPVHVEVVSAINYREDLFATLGVFVSLIAFLTPAERSHSWERGIAVAGALAFGLGGKESALVAPLLAVVLGTSLGIGRRGLAARERSIVLVVCVLILYLTHRYAIALVDDEVARAPATPLWFRLAATVRYVVHGAFVSVVPLGPRPFQPTVLGTVWTTAGSAFVLVCLVAMAIRFRANRAAFAGLAIVLLVPFASSPLTSAANETADRYFYGSALGGGLLVAAALEWLASRLDRRVVVAIGIGVLVPTIATTALGSLVWRDDLTLFRTSVALEPRDPRPRIALAWILRIHGDLDGAERELDVAASLDPRDDRIHLARGMLAAARGDTATARLIAQAIARRWGAIPGLSALNRCADASPERARACARSITNR